MKWIVGGLFIVVALLCLQSAHASCGIIVNNHAGPDSDCDSVPDKYDNCVNIPNQDQRDTDRNGIGDACDKIISEVIVNPDNKLEQGDFAHIYVRVLNNYQPSLDNVRIQLQSKQLAIDTEQQLTDIPKGETGVSEFWVKIPKCQKTGDYDITVVATFVAGTSQLTQSTSTPITVLKGTVCGTQNSTLDSTIITTIGRVEIDRGQTASIPIKIMNVGARADYDITLDDIGNLGTWSVEPQTTIPVAAGQEQTVMLSLQTEETADPGTRHLQLIVSSNGQKTTVPFDLYVRAPVAMTAPATDSHAPLQILFIIVLIVLIIAAVAIAMRTHTIQTHYVQTEKTVEKKLTRRGKTVSVEDAEPEKKTNY